MARRKRRAFSPPEGVVLPKGIGKNLRPRVATRLVELIGSKENLNDVQVVARMKAEKLKVSQCTVLRFREAMGIQARGKLGPATAARANELIALKIFTPGQIARILKEEGYKISVPTVRKRMRDASKTPLAKALEAGDFKAVKSLVGEMDSNQRLGTFNKAVEARRRLKRALATPKSKAAERRLSAKLREIELLLKACALFVPASVLEKHLAEFAE